MFLMLGFSRLTFGRSGVSTPLFQVVTGLRRKLPGRLLGHQLLKWRSGTTLYEQKRTQEFFENSLLEDNVLAIPYGTSARTTIYVVQVIRDN